MGRPPGHGGSSFRFNSTEVAEMEGILQAHNTQIPSREILISLAEKFSTSTERSGKVIVQMKQVLNWFQNRRYALRAKAAKYPGMLSESPVLRDDLATVRNVPQAPQHLSVPQAIVRNVPQAPQPILAPSVTVLSTVQSAGRNGSDNSAMEFEAKSARDGAWYDVTTFLSYRSLETSDPVIPESDYISEVLKKELIQEVLVRFVGFGQEEDEWVNVRKHVRQRSLPCESFECVAVLPGDLVLCFQEGKEQALYFDAHVLCAQQRRHDVRGCRCRFLVRYDHDQFEEIVPLRKVCRRPETDYRLQKLHAEPANLNQNKTGSEPPKGNTLKVYPPAEATQKQHKAEASAETNEHLHKAEACESTRPVAVPVSPITAAVPNADANITSVAHSSAFVATTTASMAKSNASGFTVSVATSANSVAHCNVSKATDSSATATTSVAHSSASGATVSTITPVSNSCVSGATSSAMTSATPVENFNVSRATVSTTTPVANSYVSGATSSTVTTMTPGDNANVS